MDPDSIAEKLLDTNEISQETIRNYGTEISSQVKSNKLKIINLVEKLNPILTNGDNNIRLRGVQVLSQVITSLPRETLITKELEVLYEFLNLRLVDHKSMEQPVLRCLSYFVDCDNKPEKFDRGLLELLKTKINVHKMDNKSRLIVYEICKKIVLVRRIRTKTIDSDLVYSIIHMIEGENNPQNLMACFSLVAYVMKNFNELEPYIDDLFEWLSSYYPIDYTPRDSDGGAIKRADLVDALEECFFASPLNSENLQTLLLEKLESSSTPFKIESLKSLTKCYELFPLESIKNYASSLWTSIRMNCLKKLDTVNSELLSASLEALSALSSKLSQDRELYMRFVIDMYEELAIAFRKPEMDLFEPAARLIAHAALPKSDGFDYILDKILPISLAAIKDRELRPVPGLAYVFELMFNSHNDIDLKPDITKSLCNIVVVMNDWIDKDASCLKFMNTLVKNKVKFDQGTLVQLREKLLATYDSSPLDIEESLALIAMNYSSEESTGNLLKLVDLYKHDDEESKKVELSIYLRRVVLVLDIVQSKDLGIILEELGTFLSKIRELASFQQARPKSLENIGRLHAIVFNKLELEASNPLLIEFFQSKFCQNLIPLNRDQDTQDSTKVYIPVIKWVLKSLVLRNHSLAMPIVNLILNFLTSENVDGSSALATSREILAFIFADADSGLFKKENHYQIFILYKQKFYTQISKEIKVRIGSDIDTIKKHVMTCLLALQVPHLPMGAYRNDTDWMTRELLKILQFSKERSKSIRKCTEGELASVIYDCVISLIRNHANVLQAYLSTIIELSMSFACEASSLELRRKALVCLTEVASCLDEKELLPLRSLVVDKLRTCLSDKKRLVRQEAAAARLRWVLVGQPVGS